MAGITVDFNANLARLADGVDQANQRLSNFGDNAARLAGELGGVFSALGIGISVAGMGALVKATIDEADALDVLNQKTGIAVETLAGIKFGAQLSDTEIDAVASAMNRLGRQIATNADEFEVLGVTSKDPLIALEQFADVFAGIEDPMQRAALANKVFGKSWEELAPLLSGGGQAFADLVAQGQKMSGITSMLASESAEFNDKLDVMQANLQGLRNQAIAPLIPILNDLVDYFSDTEKEAVKNSLAFAILEETYKDVAEGIAVVGYGLTIARNELKGFLAQTVALSTLDIEGFNAIDKAVDEDIAAANDRLLKFFKKIENTPSFAFDMEINSGNNKDEGDGKDRGGITAPANSAVEEFLKTGEDGQKILSKGLKDMQSELARHLRGIEANIDEEVGAFDLRNKKLEIALDLGLVDQEDYYRQKEKLQKEQLAQTEALLDQEINALRQFQSQATDEAAKSDAQEKINALIREKTKLEQDAQIATLQNAAAARQALGEYATGLTDVNDLLKGVASNIIGLSQAQAQLNLQIGGTATADDVLSKKKIFVSGDGKSFSDRPTDVGIALDLPQDQEIKIHDQLTQLRDQAVKDSAIMLGVDIDQAAAIAKVTDAASAINESLAKIDPVTLGMDVDQSMVIAAAQRARDAAQAAVQPVVIPVVYQAQNSPSTAAPDASSLTRAALAGGGR
jgi:hypothetical protein